jgi:hypothetical protein
MVGRYFYLLYFLSVQLGWEVDGVKGKHPKGGDELIGHHVDDFGVVLIEIKLDLGIFAISVDVFLLADDILVDHTSDVIDEGIPLLFRHLRDVFD